MLSALLILGQHRPPNVPLTSMEVIISLLFILATFCLLCFLCYLVYRG